MFVLCCKEDILILLNYIFNISRMRHLLKTNTYKIIENIISVSFNFITNVNISHTCLRLFNYIQVKTRCTHHIYMVTLPTFKFIN